MAADAGQYFNQEDMMVRYDMAPDPEKNLHRLGGKVRIHCSLISARSTLQENVRFQSCSIRRGVAMGIIRMALRRNVHLVTFGPLWFKDAILETCDLNLKRLEPFAASVSNGRRPESSPHRSSKVFAKDMPRNAAVPILQRYLGDICLLFIFCNS